MDGVKHSDHIFDGGEGLNIVDRVEYKAAAMGEGLASLKDFLTHLVWGTEGEGLLGIYAAAPEGDTLAMA